MRWIVTVVGIAAWASPLSAVAFPYPTVVYIPVDDVDLGPSGFGDCFEVGLSQYDPGGGCHPGLAGDETFTPSDEADEVAGEVDTALLAYDVYVTTMPPPAYLPYAMVITSDEDNLESTSYACAAAPLFCNSRGRNSISFTWPETENCTSPTITDTVLYAFGRTAGLEGKAVLGDHMEYVPDFTAGGKSWLDQCDDISPQLNDMGVPLPFECTNADHGSCGAGQVNSHADLLDYFGARVVDTDAPVLSNVQPADGSEFDVDADVDISLDIADADPIVGVQITVESDVIEAAFGGPLRACTNRHCEVDFLAVEPFKATDSVWELSLDSLPEDVYTVTFEASDYHGNVAASQTVVFTVGDPPLGGTSTGGSSGDTSSGSDTDGSSGTSTTGSADTTTGDEPESTSGNSTGPAPGSTSGPAPTSGSGSQEDGTGTPSPTTGDTDTDASQDSADEQGCGCREGRRTFGPGFALAFLALARRRRQSSSG